MGALLTLLGFCVSRFESVKDGESGPEGAGCIVPAFGLELRYAGRIETGAWSTSDPAMR